MIAKKILGVLIVLIGIAMLGGSYYIQNQVNEGKIQVASAQSKVDTGKALFSNIPVAKDVGVVGEIGKGIGKGLASSAQSKIDAGSEQIRHYEKMAFGLKMGGIALIIVGIAVVFIGRKKR